MKLLFYVLTLLFFINFTVWIVCIIRNIKGDGSIEGVLFSCLTIQIINILIQLCKIFIR